MNPINDNIQRQNADLINRADRWQPANPPDKKECMEKEMTATEIDTAKATAKASYDEAEVAYNEAKSAYNEAEVDYDEAKSACNEAGAAYEKANAAYDEAEVAYDEAKLALKKE